MSKWFYWWDSDTGKCYRSPYIGLTVHILLPINFIRGMRGTRAAVAIILMRKSSFRFLKLSEVVPVV